MWSKSVSSWIYYQRRPKGYNYLRRLQSGQITWHSCIDKISIPTKVHSHLRFIEHKLLRELFSLPNCKKNGYTTHYCRPQTKLWEGYVFTPVCDSVHTGCIPTCITSYMTNQHYISSYIGVDSQLMLGQHTGHIKYIMGLVTWYIPWADTPPGQTPPPNGQWAGGTHPTGMHPCWTFHSAQKSTK